jgi:polyribonucleotide nucleotidyltransferase
MSTMVSGKSTVNVTVGRNDMSFETGKLAKQADGAVVVRSGDTMVLATAQGRTEAREGADFFPLTVDVEERMYAAGKIPGGFFKREGRPTEKAILTARMIDRPIRPLWPKGFTNEVQVICTTLSADLITPHDILAINGASAALMISPLPFKGPVGAVRIGLVDGQLVINPSLPEVQEESTIGPHRRRHEGRPTMVEAGAEEVPEELLLEALELAHAEIKKLCEAQEELRREVGKPKWIDPEVDAEVTGHADRIRERIAADGLREAAAAIEEIAAELASPLTMDSTEEDIVREMQVRSSLDMLLETLRLEAVVEPVREQYGDELRALTEAEQDSKQLKSAKRHLLFDRIVDTVELPFPVGPMTVEGEAPRSRTASEAISEEAPNQSTVAVQKDRGRSGVRRARTGEIRPIECEVGLAHARLGAFTRDRPRS